MSFFTPHTDNVAAGLGASGTWIKDTGIYEIVILYLSVEQGNEQAIRLNLNYKLVENDTTGTLYGLSIRNRDGKPNFQAEIFNNLCIIADIKDSVKEPVRQVVDLPRMGSKELNVLEQFSNLKVKVRVQAEYSRYEGEIRENMRICNFFRAHDNKSAREIATGKDLGDYANESRIREPYYRDSVSKEEVERWKQARLGSTSNDLGKRLSASDLEEEGEDTPF